MIGQEGAARAARGPAGAQHEMIEYELAATLEQIGQSPLSFGRVEAVLLLDLYPWKRQALGVEPITQVRGFLFFQQQRCPRGQPFFLGYDWMILHVHVSV